MKGMNMKRSMCLLVLLSSQSLAVWAEEFDAILGRADVRVISIPVDGLVTHVDAVTGQRVSEGDSLIRLSPASRRFALDKARAAVAAAEPVMRDAEREKRDAEALYEQTVLSDVELQAADIAYQKAKAAHDTAVAELGFQRWAMGWTRVTSPCECIVIDSSVLPGQMIVGDTRQQVLMTLAEAGVMSAEAIVSAQRLGDIATGDPMTVIVAGDSYAGQVNAIEHIIEKNAVERVRLSVRFAIDKRAAPGAKARLIRP